MLRQSSAGWEAAVQNNNDRVLLFDVEGVHYCPKCFHANTRQWAEATVLEITFSMVVSLSAVLNQSEFVCSECGEVVAETPALRLENEKDSCSSVLENVPDRCPLCGGENIIAEFEELGREPTGITTLSLRRWICLTCSGAGKIDVDITIACRFC